MDRIALPFCETMRALFVTLFSIVLAHAALAESVASLIAQGDALDAELKSEAALKVYLKAEALMKNDASLLIKIAKQYGESMTAIPDEANKLVAGEQALAYAERALVLAPKMADASLAVAISYGKLLDLVPARKRVEYSRSVKEKADQAIKIDPKSDYAWHMLGRWHQAVSTMGGLTKAVVKIVYGGLPESSLAEAQKCFEMAHKLKPSRLVHVIELGRTLAMRGEKEAARKTIERGLAMPNRERDDAESKLRGKATLEEL
jgi:tetratricopeptide (TPR) repeat protein